jgi:hypothetical protein
LLYLKDVSNTILNEEEKTKLTILKNTNQRFDYEKTFWSAEDHPKNKGEILHLLNLSYVKDSFDLKQFIKVYDVFKNLIVNEILMWGNLISTKVYSTYYDRIICNENNWHKNEGFLKLILSRLNNANLTLEQFLIKEQKDFIKKYKTEDDLINESDLKKQVYIYYITMHSIEKSWNWMDCFNFYIHSDFHSCKSLFETKNIYQLYRSRSSESFNKILAIQKALPNKSKLFQTLSNWSNS